MKRIVSILLIIALLGSIPLSARGDTTTFAGVVQGIDGEAITVEDTWGAVWTFFFNEYAPRSELPEDIEIGSSVIVEYAGEMNEYGQLLDQPFVIYAAPQTITFEGVVRGIDGEAIAVEDAWGVVWTFFFNEYAPRSELPEDIEIGSSVTVKYAGEMNEYGQLLDQPFVIRAEEPAEPFTPILILRATDMFSVMVPAGWEIQTMGQYSAIGIRMFDPEAPEYEIFYYSMLYPFNKSQAAKDWLAENANENNPYGWYASAPVIRPGYGEDLFTEWNRFADAGTMPGFTFPELNDVTVLDVLPYDTYLSGMTLKSALVHAEFWSASGTACAGNFGVTLVSGGSYDLDGVDMMPLTAVCVSGIVAPKGMFPEAEPVLARVLCSLGFSEKYVSEANIYANAEGEVPMATTSEHRQTCTNQNAAWAMRDMSAQ
ncbi:MAG: hypothetical protein ACOYI8_00415 [Christensenellales bacterium]|jgi:hypothetical protein